MTARSPERQRRIRLMAALAGGLAVIALGAELLARPPAPRHELTGTPVIPGFAAIRSETRAIRVTVAGESYELTLGPAGWQLAEAAGYPIRADRLNTLVTGLEDLAWDGPRTRDPAKFNRIGLGDPREGGTGALIEVIGAEGDVKASLITGRREGRIYARRPGDDQAFRVTGELPPLYSADAWMDLDIISLNPDAISALRITDETGASLYLIRRPGESDRAFRPAPPYQGLELTNRLVTTGPALALTRLQPIGVKPAGALRTQPVARHITETFDGLEVETLAWRERDGLYLTLRAVEAGQGANRASAINTKARGWAFRIAEIDWADFTPRVSSMIRTPAPGTPGPGQSGSD
ncbi:DUF4340 domain-containing protein [Hyphomonas sp.]|uniref:DUF4340 domain-containing protein n=1 Tax=Hyphomonas sp. TaxID=87 RepID=UPI003918D6E4